MGCTFFKDDFFNAKKNLPNWKLYALSTQIDSFENLEGDKILGLAQVSKDSPQAINLEYLQVKPEYTHNNSLPNFKHVGSGIIDCLKNLNHVARINVISILEEIDFYIMNGFVFDLDILNESNLFWKRDLKKSDFED